MDEIIKEVFDKLSSTSFWLAVAVFALIIAVIYLICNPEKAQLWSAMFSRFFGKWSKKSSKKAIESEIKGRILSGIKKGSKEFEEILPYELKFNWTESSNRKDFFDDNRIVLCMDHNKTKNQNIIHAIVNLVDCGLLPQNIDETLDVNLSKAQKAVLTDKIIKTTYKEGRRYFQDNYLSKNIGIEVKDKIAQLQHIDNDGMFTQIALRELAMFCVKAYDLSRLEQDFGNEYSDFIDFLMKIADRDKGEDSQLSFTGNYFKIGIILMTKKDTYAIHGEKAYLKRFEKISANGANSIYLKSRGNDKIELAKDISKCIIEKYDLQDRNKFFNYTYLNSKQQERTGVCIYFDITNIDIPKNTLSHLEVTN